MSYRGAERVRSDVGNLRTNADTTDEGPTELTIRARAVFPGPSLYAPYPAVRLEIGMEPPGSMPELGPEAICTLLLRLPRLARHPAHADGRNFRQVLRSGGTVPVGVAVARMALELQEPGGASAGRSAVTPGSDQGWCNVAYAFEDAEVGLRAGELAVALITDLLAQDSRDSLEAGGELERMSVEFLDFAERRRLTLNRRALVRAAEARGISWARPNPDLIQLGQGRFQERLIVTFTSMTRVIGQKIALNKRLSNRILRDLGLPVTDQDEVRNASEAVRAAERIGYPVVVKPRDGNVGRMVTIGINDAHGVEAAVAEIRRAGHVAIVENVVEGHDHRMLIVGGELVAVARLVPGHVVGDGRRSVEALVDMVNRDPRRGSGYWSEIKHLKFDDEAERMLREARYTRESVPDAGEVIYLRATANISTGGTSVDVTDLVHPDNREMALRAAAASGLDVVAIDFITPDIACSYREVGGAICEINAKPGLRMHLHPTEGRPRDVAGPIMDLLYPPGRPARIPIAAIAGTGPSTTVAHALAHVCKLAGHRVGLAVRGDVFIDSPRRIAGDLPAPRAAGMILGDFLIDAAVLELSPADLIEHGLGFESGDVGAVFATTGASDEELRALRIILAGARAAIVLNADDEGCRQMAADAGGRRPILATVDPDNAVVSEHVVKGGAAVSARIEDGRRLIELRAGTRTTRLASLPVPPSAEDDAKPAGAVLAAAVAFALGIPVRDIEAGLSTCDGAFRHHLAGLRVRGAGTERFLVDEVRGNAVIEDTCRLATTLRDGNSLVTVLDCELDAPETRAALAELSAANVDRWILTRSNAVGRGDGSPWRDLLPGDVVEADVQLVADEREAIAGARAFIGGGRGEVLILTDRVERVCRALDRQGIVASPPSANVPAAIPTTEAPGAAMPCVGADPAATPPPHVTVTRLRGGIALAATYLSEACGADGRFVYQAALDPAVELKPRYNLLRHAGAIYALAQYSGRRSHDSRVSDAIRRAVDFFLREAVAPVPDRPEMLAVWSQDGLIGTERPVVAKLGGAGLGLIALLSAERVLPGLVAVETVRKLGEFVLYMQKPDGGFYSKLLPDRGGRNDDWTSLYYPGEAALGLVMLYERDPERRWLAGAQKFLVHLARQRRDQPKVEPDHWALLATARLLPHLAIEPSDDCDLLRGHAMQICESMLLDAAISVSSTGRRGCFTDDGRTCPTATRLEGLLAALTLVGPEEDALRDELVEAIGEGVDFLLREQVRSGPLAGAIPHSAASTGDRKQARTRIDYVQHALSAMLEYEAAFLPARRLTRAGLDEALALGRRYVLRHQRSDGSVEYAYDWHRRCASDENNQVRQAGAVWGLALLHEAEPDAEIAAALGRSLAHFERHTRETSDGRAYVALPGFDRGDLGTVALLALAHLDGGLPTCGGERDRPGSPYGDRTDAYLRFILSARARDGGFHRHYRTEDGQPFGAPSPYFDGEALLALVKAAKSLGRDDLWAVAGEFAEIDHTRNVTTALLEDADSAITKGYYQWASLAYFELALNGGAEAGIHGDRLIALADWMIDVHRVLERPRNTAYAFEGLVPAYHIAALRRDPLHARKFRHAIEDGLARLLEWQVGHSLANAHIRRHFDPTRDQASIGGVQNHAHEPQLRIDVLQHQMHAVILARRFCVRDG